MALFGRETQAELERIERVKAWAQRRSPYALASLLVGIIALIDFFTLLSLVIGPIAVTLGVMGRNDIARRPQLTGQRMCLAGMALGCTGFVLSVAFWVVMH